MKESQAQIRKTKGSKRMKFASKLSAVLKRQFRFPGPTFTKWYSLGAVLLALAAVIDTLPHFFAGLAVGFCLLVLAAIFYLVLALYIRLFYDFYESGVLTSAKNGLKEARIWLAHSIKVVQGMNAADWYVAVVTSLTMLITATLYWFLFPLGEKLAASLPFLSLGAGESPDLAISLMATMLIAVVPISILVPLCLLLARTLGVRLGILKR